MPVFVALVLFSLVFQSCQKDDPEPIDDDPISINQSNEAFYGLMKEWYFWYDQIPEVNPSSFPNPSALLEAIKKRPEDRWSYITSKQEFESYFIESKMFGHGFSSRYDVQGKLRVAFLFTDSDLYTQGVERSWTIEAINGTVITPGFNFNTLLGLNQAGVSNTFRFRKPDGTLADITSTKKEIKMNTILHSEIIEKVGLKIGYMVLNGFTTPTIAEIDSVFAIFSQNNIDELILDMRYNGGGQTNVATHLASKIAGNSLSGQPFTKYVYNDKKSAENNRTENFRTIENGLNLSRLITICTRSTASASEMVINGLQPFIDVHIIGNNTYGKPMGMNAWTYADLAFVPITFKTQNANDFGDFFDGLPADLFAPDDLSRVFGDPLESSLQQALAFITFGITKSMPIVETQYKQPVEYMTGLRAIIGAH